MPSAAPTYRWKVTDFRKGGSVEGHADREVLAKAQVVTELRRTGRGLTGLSATVFRPSGGGWFVRSTKTRGHYEWEAWEPVDA